MNENQNNLTNNSIFYKHEKAILFIVNQSAILPIFIHKLLLKIFRQNSGNIFVLIRYIAIKKLALNVGNNVYIGHNVELKSLENISIGSNVSIHSQCYIDGIGGLTIGDNVSIAHAVSIVTFNHTYSDLNMPIRSNPLKLEAVNISNDVWIGARSIILAGSTIAFRNIVAAGSVVTSTTPTACRSILAGSPARIVKEI